MVITRLSGGLGNQLFQYAAGRALSIARNAPLALDTSPLRIVAAGLTPRQYALSEFRIEAKIASTEEVSSLTRAGFMKRILNKVAPLRSRSIYHERSSRFDRNIFRLSGSVYIAGHWQSEKYFTGISAQLREDLRLRSPLSDAANALAGEIAASEHPVAMHVRRGDYLSNPNAAKHHGVLDLDYYRSAMQEIRQQAPNSRFFVFSDDPAWVRENLAGDSIRVIEAGNRSDAEDLTLMSACRDHVISNSSFGWWGAWLSRYAAKTVIAPTRWFANPDADGSDIIPPGWRRR